MMKFLFLLVRLASCATRPAFQKSGYAVTETPIPEILQFQLNQELNDKFRLDLLARAAGEECEVRHFNYFDFGTTKNGGERVFCYSKAEMPQLRATLDPKQANAPAPVLRVEDTQMGKFSPFQPWDVIRKVGGREVHDLG